ncbi:MAG: hypothetical protein WAW39_21320 [Prosthecobacter sp.]|uniref:hypothetical protein n=1 Tax=Prosthecobacter sp. TaxID=1965333 RepID=UPI003BB20671
MSNLYTLRESEFYAWQVARLGSSERMDDVLAGLLWAIARLADDFPLVPDTEKLRVAESTRFLHDDGTPLRLRIWFVVASENEVDLLAIEAEPS